MRVLHVPAKVDAEVTPILSKHISDFAPHSSVVLVATAQHLQELDCAKKFLESNGKKVFVGGQVLGCDPKPALLLSKKADCFICIGSGRFHPLAIALETDKPVYIANPLSKTFEAISEEEKRRWIGRKKGRLAKAAAAETFGILVSTKTDQFRIKEALAAKKRLQSMGKKALLFSGDLLSPENLLPFKVDAWVNTACPRIADDDYEKPVVTVKELELIF